MKATETNILNFISGSNKTFIIPPFQRNYTWETTNSKTLWDDFITAIRTDRNHYLGNVTYYLGENTGALSQELILIDGQQRVTTLLILLAAIRDRLKDENNVDDLNADYFYTGNRRDYHMRLHQVSNDSEAFQAIVEHRNLTSNKLKESKLVENYNLFVELIESSEFEPEQLLNEMKRLEIVEVNLQTTGALSVVQTIFEKMNSTGKPLSPADLIRNYILIAEDEETQRRLYEDYWVPIERELDGLSLVDFERFYIVLKTTSDIDSTKIYGAFKSHFSFTGTSGEIDREETLSEMLKYAKLFRAFKKNNFNSKVQKSLNNAVRISEYINVNDLMPFILLAMDVLLNSKPEELAKIIRLLSHYILRRRLVNVTTGGGAAMAVGINLISKFNEGNLEITYQSILEELSNIEVSARRFPSNEELANALGNNLVKIEPAKYLLMEIEEAKSLNISVDWKQVTVEHLMPQKLNEDWQEDLGGEDKAIEIHERLLDNIGNLTPISRGYNSRMQNKRWSQKRESIGKAQFELTKEVSRNFAWGEKEILERNDVITREAMKYIQGPLAKMKKNKQSFEDGWYSGADLDTDMHNAKLAFIQFDGRQYEIKNWNGYFNKAAELLETQNSEQFARMVADNILHKKSKSRSLSGFDPFISVNEKLLNKNKTIEGTEYYTEGTISAETARRLVAEMLEYFNLDEDAVQIFVTRDFN